MTNLTAQFKAYLLDNHLSSVSVKNYVSDINKFLNYWETTSEESLRATSEVGRSHSSEVNIPNQEDFQNYYNKITQNNTPSQTLKRYQSSLRKFGQFLKEEYLMPKNPAELSRDAIYGVSTQQIDLEKMIDAFAKSLEKAQAKPATIKNYLADTRQFLDWISVTSN